MTRWIEWLAARPKLTAVLAAGYYLLNVVFHDHVQSVALYAIERLTVQRVNVIGAVLAAIAFLASMPWFVARLRRGPHARLMFLYAIATLAFVLLAYRWLFAVNSEAIHFPQYAILAFLIFPIVGRFGETAIWVTLLGAFDEAFQYWVLHGGWDVYLDFNDFVLNLLGAVIGVLVVAVILEAGPRPSARSTYTIREFLRSPAFVALAVVAIACAVLLATGRMTLYKDPELAPWLVLRRIGPPVVFWSRPEWGRAYHVLMPLEGVLVTLGLAAFFVGLDFRLGRPRFK